ncbi:hypothetical protein ACV229_35875 [Burkholderia sp. MR1-5-21]
MPDPCCIPEARFREYQIIVKVSSVETCKAANSSTRLGMTNRPVITEDANWSAGSQALRFANDSAKFFAGVSTSLGRLSSFAKRNYRAARHRAARQETDVMEHASIERAYAGFDAQGMPSGRRIAPGRARRRAAR